jgi:magnesium chelatase family protein
VDVPAVEYEDLTDEATGASSGELRENVELARDLQAGRLDGSPIHTNAKMTNNQVKEACQVSDEGERILKRAIDQLGLSARAYMKVLKIARTIADLEESETIQPRQVTEAVQYRSLDRQVT